MTKVRPIQTIIGYKPVIKYVILLKQSQLEWKGALKSTQRMGKSLHKAFKTVVKEISQKLTPLGESGS